MSDLASNCEYLTIEKICLAVSESEKAKASRQVRCRNDEKMTCCYLCMFVLDCATPCKFLGNGEIEPERIEAEKPLNENATTEDQQTEEDKAEHTSATFCSACNAEMAQSRTKFRIDGWKGLPKDESQKRDEQELPIIVYLCPKCGKLDFKAEEKQNKN